MHGAVHAHLQAFSRINSILATLLYISEVQRDSTKPRLLATPRLVAIGIRNMLHNNSETSAINANGCTLAYRKLATRSPNETTHSPTSGVSHRKLGRR